MTGQLPIPENLSKRWVRREGWYKPADAEAVLDWLESVEGRFLGFDVAEQLDDGKWMLLVDPIQDLSNETDRTSALKSGRKFLEKNKAHNRIFEPVWEGRYK